MLEAILILSLLVLGYALVSRRLESTSITGPMVFTVAGMMLGIEGFGMVGGSITEGGVELLAEVTLLLLLFTDATRIDLEVLRKQSALPARLLGIGLPLTIVLGTLAAALVFPALGFWEAALLAAILSPTDAALGHAVVSDPRIPVRIRQALNVESGLNDGIMLPVITMAVTVAALGVGTESTGFWALFAIRQIGLGMLIGAAVGFLGGRAIDVAVHRSWVKHGFRQLATVAVGVAAYATADLLGGNGFVAAFAAGLAFGLAARRHCAGAADFAEDEGQLLSLLTFLFFGAILAGPALTELTPRVAVYVVLSLTAVRMVPVALALSRTGLRGPTIGFMGWFGPRGLASILFGLSILEGTGIEAIDDIILVVTWTVLASIFLHGISAVPLTGRYAQWFAVHGHEEMPEAEQVEAMRPRLGAVRRDPSSGD